MSLYKSGLFTFKIWSRTVVHGNSIDRINVRLIFHPCYLLFVGRKVLDIFLPSFSGSSLASMEIDLTSLMFILRFCSLSGSKLHASMFEVISELSGLNQALKYSQEPSPQIHVSPLSSIAPLLSVYPLCQTPKQHPFTDPNWIQIWLLLYFGQAVYPVTGSAILLSSV